MTPLDEAAQAATVTARAAAGLCAASEMQRTIDEAQADIAQSAEAMVDDAAIEADLSAYALHGAWQKEIDDEAAAQLPADDFSLCNDAALAGIADQGDDWLDWRWTCGDLGL